MRTASAENHVHIFQDVARQALDMDLTKRGHKKNEIDYILTDKPHVLTDASVINRFNTGDDHCMVRGTLTSNTKLERARLARRQKRQNEVVLSEKAVEFQLLLTKRFEALQLETTDDLDTYNNNLTFPKGLDSTDAAIIFKNTTTLLSLWNKSTYLQSERRS